jgi:hypothetical protein
VLCQEQQTWEQQQMARPEVTGRAPPRDPTINGFCCRKGISRSTWNNWRRQGKTPRYVQPAGPGGKITIPPEAEADWDEKYAVPLQATG